MITVLYFTIVRDNRLED